MGYDLQSLSDAADVQASAVLKRLLQGVDTKNVPDIVKRAEALANKYVGVNGDKGKDALYKFLYMQARQAIELAASNKYVAQVGQVVQTGLSVGGNVKAIVDKFKSDVPMDVSGVADIAGISHQITSSLTKLAVGFGLSSDVAAEIEAWSGIAAGCASSVASMGPYAGGAACGLQVLGKIVDILSAKPAVFDGPKAIFVPKKDQALVAAADAARLARMLRYGFGTSKYAYMAQRMVDVSRGIGNPYLAWPQYPGKDSQQKPAVGVEMRSAAAAMCFYLDKPDDVWISEMHPWLTTNHVLVTAGEKEFFGSQGRAWNERDVEDAYSLDYDVNCEAISGLAHRWHSPYVSEGAAGVQDWRPGLAGFVNLNYLLNAFAALSIHEWQTKRRAAILSYLQPNELPVRLAAVCDSGDGCRYDWAATENYQPYGKWCWTSLNRCDIGTSLCQTLRAKLDTGDRCYFRELAAIRLMAAFSYIHMVWMWAERDMIAELPSPSDPYAVLEKPVDLVFWPPSKASMGSPAAGEPLTDWQQIDAMRAQLKAREQLAVNVNKIAREAAAADHLNLHVSSQVAQSAGPAFPAMFTSSQDPIRQAIKSGELLIETWAQVAAKCKAAGGVPVKQSDGSVKCTPASKSAGSSGGGAAVALTAAAVIALALAK